MQTRLLKQAGLLTALLLLIPAVAQDPGKQQDALLVGLAETDITPRVDGKKVYMAGFGHNRLAKGVHDPLMARAIVFTAGKDKIALVSVDLVGLFFPVVERVRTRLPGFTYVLVSSTHNHEGPDTLGLWGPHPFQSGIDPEYLAQVETQIVSAVQRAEKAATAVQARIGSVQAPELLHDGREPYVKHDDLVTLSFHDVKTGKRTGLLVQWNCHPETLDSRNTQISADFVHPTVTTLAKRYECPVVYFTGTVAGLMTSLHVPIKDAQGKDLKDGTFEKTTRYGELLAERAGQALDRAQPLTLTPLRVQARPLYLPLANQAFLLGWQLGVLKRPTYRWQGKTDTAEPLEKLGDHTGAVKSELAYLQLGELSIAAIPGEIYPELVLGKVQDPADPNADFPQAAIEPGIYAQLPGKHRLLIGLANDELGYIIPKGQWDEKAPYCYGRKQTQYGEINSLGPETAPLLCAAFRQLTAARR